MLTHEGGEEEDCEHDLGIRLDLIALMSLVLNGMESE